MRFILCVILLASGWSAQARAAVGVRVVTSIRPLHSIASAVMQGAGEPDLLLKGNESPHGYQLRPSQVLSLRESDLVFYIDEHFESFLAGALEALPEKTVTVPLAEEDGMTLYDIRAGGVWEEHRHGEGGDGSHEGHEEHEHHQHRRHSDIKTDFHIWMDTGNAARMARAMARELGRLDPENFDLYRRNADGFAAALNDLSRDLESRVSEVREVPYIVFHDAFQYFERQFGMSGAGAVTLDPHVPPPVKRVIAVREKITNSGAACVFHEPRFDTGLVHILVEATNARSAALDPLGLGIEPGPELYNKLLTGLADDLAGCLIQSRDGMDCR